MRIFAVQGGSTVEADVRSTDETVTVTRKGHTSSFRYRRSPAGITLIQDGLVYDVRHLAKAGRWIVNGRRVDFSVTDPREALSQRGVSDRATDGEIRAVMPGRVLRIRVRKGARVSVGDPLLVLEAMKMENEIQSPCDGVVEKLAVEEGASVEANALLLQLRVEGNGRGK